MTSRQRVEARYPGAYVMKRHTYYTRPDANPFYVSNMAMNRDFLIFDGRKIIGSGKTERAAWINAARGIT